MEPQTAFRSDKGYRNPRLRRLEALQRRSTKEALKAIGAAALGRGTRAPKEEDKPAEVENERVNRSSRPTTPDRNPPAQENDADDEDESPPWPPSSFSREAVQPTPLPYKWTMPRNKLYREAYYGATKALPDSEIESMMNSGWLIEDATGLRYAINGKYILYSIGKGKAPEAPENLKPDLVKEHVARTLGRVNLEGEEEVQRPGTPLEDPRRAWESDPGMVGSSRWRGRKSVRFNVNKDIFDERGQLVVELVMDNEGKSREMNRAWREGRRERRKKEKEVEAISGEGMGDLEI